MMNNVRELREGLYVFSLSLVLSVLFALVSRVGVALPLARFLGLGAGREAPAVLALSLAALLLRRGPAASRGGALTNMRVLLLAAYLRAMLSAGLAVAAAGCNARALECQVLGVI